MKRKPNGEGERSGATFHRSLPHLKSGVIMTSACLPFWGAGQEGKWGKHQARPIYQLLRAWFCYIVLHREPWSEGQPMCFVCMKANSELVGFVFPRNKQMTFGENPNALFIVPVVRKRGVSGLRGTEETDCTQAPPPPPSHHLPQRSAKTWLTLENSRAPDAGMLVSVRAAESLTLDVSFPTENTSPPAGLLFPSRIGFRSADSPLWGRRRLSWYCKRHAFSR